MHELLPWLLQALLITGLPFLVALIFLLFFVKGYSRERDSRLTDLIFLLGVVLAIALWICLYGEHYTHGAVLLFDVGAPLLSLSALIVFPTIVISHALSAGKPARNKHASILKVSAYILFLLSIGPGIYMVWFYAAAL